MKELYLCEKCGKMHTSYNDAWECERSHITVEQMYSWDLPSGSHHDGTNHYLYRELRDLSDKQMENFLEKLHTGRLTRRDIRRYTTSVGIHVNKVYGW